MAMGRSQTAMVAGLMAHEAEILLVRKQWWYYGVPPFCLGCARRYWFGANAPMMPHGQLGGKLGKKQSFLAFFPSENRLWDFPRKLRFSGEVKSVFF